MKKVWWKNVWHERREYEKKVINMFAMEKGISKNISQDLYGVVLFVLYYFLVFIKFLAF